MDLRWTRQLPAWVIFAILCGIASLLGWSLFTGKPVHLGHKDWLIGAAVDPAEQAEDVDILAAILADERFDERVAELVAARLRAADTVRLMQSYARDAGLLSKVAAWDSNWFDVSEECKTYRFDTGLSFNPSNDTLPIMSAFYKNGDQQYPFGINQYGDTNQTNGVLLDFDASGQLYVRLGCDYLGKSTGGALHLGNYSDRGDAGSETIFNSGGQFRVMLWR